MTGGHKARQGNGIITYARLVFTPLFRACWYAGTQGIYSVTKHLGEHHVVMPILRAPPSSSRVLPVAWRCNASQTIALSARDTRCRGGASCWQNRTQPPRPLVQEACETVKEPASERTKWCARKTLLREMEPKKTVPIDSGELPPGERCCWSEALNARGTTQAVPNQIVKSGLNQ